MNTIRMSNSLDPDQAQRFVGPDLGPNCLPRLSADDTGRKRVKHTTKTNQTGYAQTNQSSLADARIGFVTKQLKGICFLCD